MLTFIHNYGERLRLVSIKMSVMITQTIGLGHPYSSRTSSLGTCLPDRVSILAPIPSLLRCRRLIWTNDSVSQSIWSIHAARAESNLPVIDLRARARQDICLLNARYNREAARHLIRCMKRWEGNPEVDQSVATMDVILGMNVQGFLPSEALQEAAWTFDEDCYAQTRDVIDSALARWWSHTLVRGMEDYEQD